MKALHRAKLIKHFVTYGGFSAGTLIFSTLTIPIITAYLSPSEYGLLGIALAGLSFAVPVATLGNQQNIQINRNRLKEDDYAVFWDNLCTFTMVASLSILMLTLGAISLFEAPLVVLFLPALAMIRAYRLMAQSELIVDEKSIKYGISTILISIIGLVCSLALFEGISSGAGSRLGALLFAELFVVVVLLKVRFRLRFVTSSYRAIWRVGWPLIIAVLPAWVINEAGKFVLLKNADMSDVGIFSLSLQISAVFLQFNSVLSNTFVRNIIDDIEAGVSKRLCLIITVLQVFSAMVFIFISGVLGVFVLPTSYHPGLPVAQILVLGALFQSFGLIPSYFLNSFNKNNYRLYSLAAAATVGFFLNVMLVPSLGVFGAAWSYVISMVIYSILLVFFALGIKRVPR